VSGSLQRNKSSPPPGFRFANYVRYVVLPGYQRQQPIRRPKLGPWVDVIGAILDDDQRRPAKQRLETFGLAEVTHAIHDALLLDDQLRCPASVCCCAASNPDRRGSTCRIVPTCRWLRCAPFKKTFLFQDGLYKRSCHHAIRQAMFFCQLDTWKDAGFPLLLRSNSYARIAPA
jgi:hypothetical protein